MPVGIDRSVERHAETYGVPAQLVRAVIQAESAGNPFAVSSKGAQGIMQLMPATSRRFDVRDPMNPDQNIEGGVRYLSWLLDRYRGNTSLAVAAYNAGEGAVEKHGGVPPYRETRAYVRKVMGLSRETGTTRRLPAPKSPDGVTEPSPIEVVRGSGGSLVFQN